MRKRYSGPLPDLQGYFTRPRPIELIEFGLDVLLFVCYLLFFVLLNTCTANLLLFSPSKSWNLGSKFGFLLRIKYLESAIHNLFSNVKRTLLIHHVCIKESFHKITLFYLSNQCTALNKTVGIP